MLGQNRKCAPQIIRAHYEWSAVRACVQRRGAKKHEGHKSCFKTSLKTIDYTTYPPPVNTTKPVHSDWKVNAFDHTRNVMLDFYVWVTKVDIKKSFVYH